MLEDPPQRDPFMPERHQIHKGSATPNVAWQKDDKSRGFAWIEHYSSPLPHHRLGNQPLPSLHVPTHLLSTLTPLDIIWQTNHSYITCLNPSHPLWLTIEFQVEHLDISQTPGSHMKYVSQYSSSPAAYTHDRNQISGSLFDLENSLPSESQLPRLDPLEI